MFRNREDAALQLVARLRDHELQDPLVLAIPRGGVAIGAVLARELHAELDVLLCRRLRAPGNPESAIGALGEIGAYFLNEDTPKISGLTEVYIEEEVRRQSKDLAVSKELYRKARPVISRSGRSIILTDDGISTGATMVAALRTLRFHRPLEVVVAVPIAAQDEIDRVSRWCAEVVCARIMTQPQAVRQAYADFPKIDDNRVIQLLKQSTAQQTPIEQSRCHGPVCLPIGYDDHVPTQG